MENKIPSALLETATQIGTLLQEHKASDVQILDVQGRNSITDCFIIASATSATHLKALAKYARIYIKEHNLEVYLTKRKFADSDDWILIDVGSIIIHLLTTEARQFYDLEALYAKSFQET